MMIKISQNNFQELN